MYEWESMTDIRAHRGSSALTSAVISRPLRRVEDLNTTRILIYSPALLRFPYFSFRLSVSKRFQLQF